MESPEPDRGGRRKRLEELENAFTGGHHISDSPIYVQEIEG